MADSSPPHPAELTIMAAGVVGLIASFLSFAGDQNAWGTFALPIVTLIPIYLVIMAVQIALAKFTSVSMPEQVMGFTWEQIHLVLGFFAALMALSWLIAAEDQGAGLYLLVLASIAALVGAVMLQRERATGGIG